MMIKIKIKSRLKFLI